LFDCGLDSRRYVIRFHSSHPISFAHESHNLVPPRNRVVGLGSLSAGLLRRQLSQLHLMQIFSNRSRCA
jgi:hypothetical protein